VVRGGRLPPAVAWQVMGRDAAALLAFIALCLGVAAAGGAVTASSVGTWYAALAKPSFNPPNWVFAPVWTALYLMMAVAAWRVWRRRGAPGAHPALAMWALQLALNLCWSYVFFGLRLIGGALAEIAVLLAAILVTALLSWRIDRVAGALLAPYAAWVAFAALLNAALWRLN
jgi:tryptophan-rich sensory protein